MSKHDHAPALEYTRREAITKVATTSVAAGAAIGLGVWLTGRKAVGETELETIRDHRVQLPSGATQMVIARGPDATQNTRKAIEALGGMGVFVKRGERVLIKPNVGWNRLPNQAANSNPDVVAEVIRHVKAAGAVTVWVTDVSVNKAERCFARSGIGDAVRNAGAELVLPTDSRFRTVGVGGQLLRVAEVLWPFVEADKIINIPIVKQHGLSGATMAMKNWYGVVGGHRARMHQDIHRSIFELTTMMKPTLTIMDATRVLMANGPSGGSLDDVKAFNTIAAGIDEVALDAFGCSFLGLSASDLGYLTLGERAGLGTTNYRSLKLEEVSS